MIRGVGLGWGDENVRNMWTSENDPMILSSSPKILDGGQLTLAALAYTLGGC